MAVAHYLDALVWQRDAVALHAIFGGKNPHPMFVVGGTPVAISIWPEGAGGAPRPAGGQSGTALDVTGLARVQEVIRSMRDFVDQVYVPDTLAIAGFYKDWFRQGEGLGNFMTYGDFPAKGMSDIGSFMLPRGAILNRDLSHIEEIDLNAEGEIQEYVNNSWYDYAGGKEVGLHPYQGETTLNYTGPKPPYAQLEVDKAYSWLKSPRWKGKPMEVGPLARVLMLYAKGHAQTKDLVGMTLKKLDLPVEALYSTLGRTAARTLETKIIVDAMQGWYDQLVANIKAGDVRTFNETLWDPATWPKHCQGVGFMEAPRGGLGHWIVIENGKTANYQAVVPSTWNAGPRDPQGQAGAYEAALKGHAIHDGTQPIEVLRTIHSFDPCIACAVHVVDLAAQSAAG
jgi:hydrogenase large subunit